MLICSDRTVSRAELLALAYGRAARLAACGIGEGDLVGLCLPNGCEWVVTYLALARLQACCVPLNAASADAEIAHVVRDCGMRALFVSAARAGAAPHAWPTPRERRELPKGSSRHAGRSGRAAPTWQDGCASGRRTGW
jgi:acyl-CoA synthetase (AMP-forming)/AMP-acid ligase II